MLEKQAASYKISNTSNVGVSWKISRFLEVCYWSLLLKLAITFPEHFLLKGVIYILLNMLFANIFFHLQTCYSKCLKLTPCITKRNHVWKYHLIFLSCDCIIDFSFVSELLDKRSRKSINLLWKYSFLENGSLCFNFRFEDTSLPEVFYKTCVLKNFAKFTGKHLCRRLLIKLQASTCNFTLRVLIFASKKKIIFREY